MAYSKYQPEILKMIHLLSISRKKLIGKELEEYLSSKLDGVSVRTIHRWLKYVRSIEAGERTFDYYPTIKYSNFNLMKCEVMLRKPKDPRLLTLVPHLYWAGLMRDKDFNEVLILHYLIPPYAFSELIRIFEDLNNGRLFESLEIWLLNRGMFIPSPFHEIVNPDGELILNSDIDNSGHVMHLRAKQEKITMVEDLKEEPILVPLIFESDKESSPYEQIWSGIKNHLGGRIGDYLNGNGSRFPKEKGQGGMYVQNMFKNVNSSYDTYYDHVCVYYRPFYEIKNLLVVNLSLDFEEQRTRWMEKAISRISGRCLFITSYMSEGMDGRWSIRMNLHTTFDHFFNIMRWLNESRVKYEFYFMDREKSWLLWNQPFSKFSYWSLFDPSTVTWKFDSIDYQKRADRIQSRV